MKSFSRIIPASILQDVDLQIAQHHWCFRGNPGDVRPTVVSVAPAAALGDSYVVVRGPDGIGVPRPDVGQRHVQFVAPAHTLVTAVS